MNCVSCLLINLLQHRISLQFLINRCIGNAKNVINDMNETVRCCNVGLNNCSINTSTLYSYRLVVIFTVHDIEVKEFLFDIRWNLNNLRIVEKVALNDSTVLFLISSSYLMIVIRPYFLRVETLVYKM